MRVPSWSLPAILLLAGAQHVTAKAIFSPRLPIRQSNLDDVLDLKILEHETSVERRSAQNQQAAPTNNGQNTGELRIGGSPAEVNSTVSRACEDKLRELTSVENPAGFAGCYNILWFDPATSAFQSDLRIYEKSPSTGQFAGIGRNDILVVLNFPSSTTFTRLQKRDEDLVVRQENDDEEKEEVGQGGNTPTSTEFQQYSFTGSFSTPLDMKKLDEMGMAALMIPQISLQATTGGQTFTANMTADDMALLVTGKFTDLAPRAKELADPKTAADAVNKSKGFVLPGTTFGIFPLGFIITSVWTVIFLLAYGIGTIMRFRYRDVYRKRSAYLAGTSYQAPGVGKL